MSVTESDKEARTKQYTRQLLWSMADVTWRMFLAPALFVSIGLYADIHWRTKPWLTILGCVLGLGVSIILVRAQLRGSQ